MPDKFVVIYDDGTLTLAPERTVSKMFDLADCDQMDGVAGIYAVDEHCNLVQVTVGAQVRDTDWEVTNGIYYASAPIKAGKRTVGFVHYSDH